MDRPSMGPSEPLSSAPLHGGASVAQREAAAPPGSLSESMKWRWSRNLPFQALQTLLIIGPLTAQRPNGPPPILPYSLVSLAWGRRDRPAQRSDWSKDSHWLQDGTRAALLWAGHCAWSVGARKGIRGSAEAWPTRGTVKGLEMVSCADCGQKEPTVCQGYLTSQQVCEDDICYPHPTEGESKAERRAAVCPRSCCRRHSNRGSSISVRVR